MNILQELKEKIEQNRKQVDAWYRKHCEKVRLPLYASIDIRNSGFKLAAIDTNLFPAGFNNIFPRDLQVASSIVADFIRKKHRPCKKILLIPEDHTRNISYLQNLTALSQIFSLAGFELRLGTLSTEMRKDQVEIQTGTGDTLLMERAYFSGQRLIVKDFDPDLIVLNNDFSSSPPEELRHIEQPIEPPLTAGWFTRRKSNHLKFLDGLVREFCEVIKVDPWFMSVETELVTDVDINDASSRQKLAEVGSEVLARVKKQHEKHGIKSEPYLFLKDNSGTYGFAVMNIKDPEEILTLNSKMRRKMSAGKGKSRVDEILVQEGIPTEVWVHDCPAEPVIYLMGGEVIGGFFRQHCAQDALQSLNVKGMVFSILTFSSPLETDVSVETYKDDTALQVYGNLARIAYLAAGYELKELEK